MLIRHNRPVAVTYAARKLLGSRSKSIVVLAAGLLALTSAHASAAGGRCAHGQPLGPCALGLVSGIVDPRTCPSEAAPYQTPPRAQTAAERLQSLIDYIPCPQTGHVSFDTRDNTGESMSVLDALPNPAGGYVGVYHSEFRPPGGPHGADFRISLARSGDLIHWTRLAILDSRGASMPTLSTFSGGPGYLLAYEKLAPDGGNVVRLRYYPSIAALAANRFTAQRDIPRMFSLYNNGTPTILWAHWNGALARSAIGLGFHYEASPARRRGPDREGIGTLRDFRFWSARTDPDTDAGLDRQGLSGSHGDWRQFGFAGDGWRVYEAQTAFDDFGTWRVVLESRPSGHIYPLTLTMGARPVSSSFANPVVHVEPAPHGHGQVLLVTMFLFNARSPGAPGELLYYQPI
jgi:hypothetical protein